MNYFLKKHTLFYRIIRKTDCCDSQKQRKQNEAIFHKTSHAPGEIYDQVQDNVRYQELGEVSKHAINEKIK